MTKTGDWLGEAGVQEDCWQCRQQDPGRARASREGGHRDLSLQLFLEDLVAPRGLETPQFPILEPQGPWNAGACGGSRMTGSRPSWGLQWWGAVLEAPLASSVSCSPAPHFRVFGFSGDGLVDPLSFSLYPLLSLGFVAASSLASWPLTTSDLCPSVWLQGKATGSENGDLGF